MDIAKDVQPGSTQREIVLKGTPQQVQICIQLVNQKIAEMTGDFNMAYVLNEQGLPAGDSPIAAMNAMGGMAGMGGFGGFYGQPGKKGRNGWGIYKSVRVTMRMTKSGTESQQCTHGEGDQNMRNNTNLLDVAARSFFFARLSVFF